ncbi:MAG: sigma factor-like helix-turn-helix DNA-binding protein [Streptosporangiaceae bacterium]
MVLRYYIDLSEEETARSMGVRRGTVKSATSRALAALGQRMQEYS